MTSLIIYIGCVYVVLLIRLSAFALSDSCRCTKWIRHLSGISCKKHFLSTIRKLNFPISFHFVCSVVVGFSTHVSSVSNGNRFFFLFSFSLNLFEILVLVCGCVLFSFLICPVLALSVPWNKYTMVSTQVRQCHLCPNHS